MTESEIDLRIIDDVVRIMTIADAWKSSEPKDWERRANNIARKMNSGQEHVILGRLQAIRETGVPAALSESYLNSTCTLLKYRIEKYSESDQTRPKLKPALHGPLVDRNRITSGALKYSQQLSKELCDPANNGKVIISFDEVEKAGSVEALDNLLQYYLPWLPVKVSVVDSLGVHTIREKNTYCGHKPWIVSQLMPIVLISRKNPEE